MKIKTIFATSLLIAGVAFADTASVDTDGYVLGVFPLSVGKEAIINIPWVEAGSASGATTIAVENIVKTATLKAGDKLYYYDGTGYKAWQVVGAEDTVKTWQPVAVANQGGVSASAGATALALARGRALILDREVSYSSADTVTIYIVGQYSNAAAASVPISSGYNLLAPIAVSGSTNLAAYNWAGATDGDQLILGVTNRYEYNNGSWRRYTYNSTTKEWGYTTYDNIALPAGNGVFFYHTGASFNFDWALKNN